MVVADLPFGSYQASPTEALHAAVRFMKEAGAHAVKLEGGQRVAHHVEELVAAGIPVMGHLGLTPQSVHAFGGFRVQGRGEAGERLLHDAKALEAAGAFAVVLEGVPVTARRARSPSRCTSRRSASAPAPDCDAQVLVWQDMAGLSPRSPKFAKRYADLAGGAAHRGDPSSRPTSPAALSRRRSTPTASARRRRSASRRRAQLRQDFLADHLDRGHRVERTSPGWRRCPRRRR